MNEKNYFERLAAINCKEHIEKKNGLSFLSWAYAWDATKRLFPDAIYSIYENKDGWNYHTDGKTCWVKTGVTINGIEHIEMLPVMDFKNRSIPFDNVTSMDVNKAIQRSLTKAVARHGLGLYIYAGEDLPEDMGIDEPEEEPTPAPKKKPAAKKEEQKIPEGIKCQGCDGLITDFRDKAGKDLGAAGWEKQSRLYFGKCLCSNCMKSGKFPMITRNVD